MPVAITYDKDGNQIPSREFLSMVIVLLRKCEMETGTSFIGWLESFEDRDAEIDGYENKQLKTAIYKMLKENYLDQEANK